MRLCGATSRYASRRSFVTIELAGEEGSTPASTGLPREKNSPGLRVARGLSHMLLPREHDE